MDRPLMQRVLIANRGEIAIRIARTCRELGVSAVLAHSEDDASSLAARLIGATVSLGDGDARSTYLSVEKIIDAARRSGADAVHPGYGFLSERAALASACADAGIAFIGPSAESIELMGSKSESRKLMEKLGVPVVPGYHGDDQSNATMVAEGTRIGFPLLVKASAGGGGKGMKIVRSAAELEPAIESARREALKAFGDDRLLMEKYIENPRHVEVQVFGDAEKVIHLFERDCSIQRRHQKVVEESPAPHYPDELRQKMTAAAIRAAEGVKYRNAGTVEFILTPEGEFYFLEMNTRLQVEHPVTELVVGVDLVRAQLEVAAGHLMPWRQQDLSQRGHAMEVRVYAEDPYDRFLPQTGTVAVYREPVGPGIRVDSGIREGSTIGVRYDPMLSKVIAYAETRELAAARLARALREYVILGTATNAGYLRRIIEHPEFLAGRVDTHFLERHESELQMRPDPEAAAVAAVLADAGRPSRPSSGNVSAELPSPWERLAGWSV